MNLSPEAVLELVPQRPPFRFLDRLLRVDADGAVGEYRFRADEHFYRGHFPSEPITPGVILLETMCQTGVVALGIYLLAQEAPLEEVQRTLTLFTESAVEFERVVRPEETVRVVAEKVYWRRRKLKSRVTLSLLDGTRVASGTVAGIGAEAHGR